MDCVRKEIWKNVEDVEMIWRQETYLLRCYLQIFLFRACLGAAVDMGRFEMNWEGCFVVFDHSGTELLC